MNDLGLAAILRQRSGTVSAILVATLYVPSDTSGIDRLFDGLIGAAIGLVIDGVFARGSVCRPAVAVSGTGARGAAS